MKAKLTQSVVTDTWDIFELWKNEDHYLQAQFDQIRDWMLQVSQLGIPRFGETAGRLRLLRDCLNNHFEREKLLCDQLSGFYTSPCPQVDSIRRQATRDHYQLMQRIDDLIDDLTKLEPPFDSWGDAMERVEQFIDTFEQHEQFESESIRSMIPSVT